MSELEIQTLPEMRLAAVLHKGAYHQIPATFEALGAKLAAAEAFYQTRGFVGAYYDNPYVTPEPDLRSHAGAIWAGGPDLPEGTEEVIIPAGRYMVYALIGPYSGLAEAWGKMDPSKIGVTMRNAAALEIYRNDPTDTPEDQLHTDLCVPVE